MVKRYLEILDDRDRQDGRPRVERLRQILPETGRFIALLAAAAPAGDVIEIWDQRWLLCAVAGTGLPDDWKIADYI